MVFLYASLAGDVPIAGAGIPSSTKLHSSLLLKKFSIVIDHQS
jgi:hypothetical protein